MSDESAPAAAPAESAPAPVDSGPPIESTGSVPTTTQAIAASVIQEATDEDAPPEPLGEPPTPPPPPPELSLEEQLLHEYGFKEARWPDGREHRIPRSKVLAMIGAGLKRGQTKWDGERTTLQSTATQYQQAVESFLGGVRGDPTAFLAELAAHDPRYQAFLAHTGNGAAAAAAPPPAPAMPAPDLQLPDGSRTYSVDGLQALLDWNTAKVEARLLPKVEAQLKPWQEREAQHQAEAAQQALVTKVRGQIETAKTWDHWADYEPEILTTLQADTAQATREGRRPTMSVREAYLEVKATHLGADRNTVREELRRELNSAPKSTAVTRAGHEPIRQPGPRTTTEIARATIAALESGS